MDIKMEKYYNNSKKDKKNFIKPNNISSQNRTDNIKKNYELLTEPVKDPEGRIIEPSRYLDANPYNPKFELQMLFEMLPKNQQEAFLQVMREAVDKLNTNIDIKKGGK